MWTRILILLLCCSAGAEIIPTYRRTDWTYSGVRGGIPDSSAMTVWTNCATNVTLAQLNAVLASCPSNQVVQLTNGNFFFSAAVNFGRARGVVLRGRGPTNTFITMSGGGDGSIVVGVDGDRLSPSAGNVKRITGGLTQGSSSIVLTNTTNLPEVGSRITIDQLEYGIIEENIQEGCTYCSRASGQRSHQQWCTITSSNGTTVGISPPLHSCLWSYDQSPEAWWSTDQNVRRCGVESFSVTNTAGAGLACILFDDAADSWVVDVEIYKSRQYAVEARGSTFIEMRRVSMLSAESAASQSYGFVPYQSSGCIMVDCIAANITGAVDFGPGASGCVIAFNYFTNLLYSGTWDIAAIGSHDAHTHMNLVEGNWANKMYYDSIHGSASHNTDFRNFYHGKQVGRDQNTIAYAAQGWCLSNNVIGNILGTSGHHTNFDVTLSTTEWNNYGYWTCLMLGLYTTLEPERAAIWDDRVAASTIVHGNWSTSIDKPGQQWDSGIVDHTIPDSLLFASKPAWFGFLTWPPFDPVVVNTSPTNIPAGYRFFFGTNPPAGPSATPMRMRATSARIGTIRAP